MNINAYELQITFQIEDLQVVTCVVFLLPRNVHLVRVAAAGVAAAAGAAGGLQQENRKKTNK